MERKLRILLIDDDKMVHTMVKAALTEDEFEFRGAFDVMSGLKEVLGYQPDLILLDYLMPEHDGEEAIKELKSHRVTKRIPVVMLSAEEDPKVMENFYTLGALDFVSKPIIPNILKSKILNLASNMHLTEGSGKSMGSQLYCFMGTKGGAGTSTVAANSAYVLADHVSENGEQVLLTETHSFHLSMRNFFTEKSSLNFCSVLAEHPFDLDEEFISKEIAKADNGLYLLPSGKGIGHFGCGFDEEDLNLVHNVLSNHIQHIVVDMENSFSPSNMLFYKKSNAIFLVSDPGYPSLWNLKDTVEALVADGIDQRKIFIILNKMGKANKRIEKEVEALVKVPCVAKFKLIPDKYAAAEEERTLAVLQPKGNIINEYQEFVKKMLELKPAEVEAEVAQV